MTDLEAIIRAIIEKPDEDTPILALADYFLENGAERIGRRLRLAVELVSPLAGKLEKKLDEVIAFLQPTVTISGTTTWYSTDSDASPFVTLEPRL